MQNFVTHVGITTTRKIECSLISLFFCVIYWPGLLESKIQYRCLHCRLFIHFWGWRHER